MVINMTNKSTNADRIVIIDKVICFLLYSMHSATADNVQKVAVATFTFEEICLTVLANLTRDEVKTKPLVMLLI